MTNPSRIVFTLGLALRIPLGEARLFRVNGRAVAVFRQRDGQIFATQSHCPHCGVALTSGVLGAGRLLCPTKSCMFDLQAAVESDARGSLTTYAIEEIAGQIFIDVSDSSSLHAAPCAAN
jgi:nitrite reductase (NADH) small subunit